MKDYQLEWKNFWKDIVTTRFGFLNKKQIMKELYNYSQLIKTASEVFSYITGGKLNKTNYSAEMIIKEADNYYNKCVDELWKDFLDIFEDKIKECESKEDIINFIKNYHF